LKKKRIVTEFGRKFVNWIIRRRDKPYDTGAKYVGQALKRGQGRSNFAALDLADVGPRHSHAESDFFLGEVSQLSEVENVEGDAVAD
jgi:hypothetical protein